LFLIALRMAARRVCPGVIDFVPVLQNCRHRGRYCVLGLRQIPASEDDVPHQRLIGDPEELREIRSGKRRVRPSHR
jgi:hypothetical protein